MLSHYQIGVELSRGATSVMYQATHARLGCAAAIKTVVLSRELEADQPEEVRAPVFGETESAGRLAIPMSLAATTCALRAGLRNLFFQITPRSAAVTN